MTKRLVTPSEDEDRKGRLDYVIGIELKESDERRNVNIVIDNEPCPLFTLDIQALRLKRATVENLARMLGKTMLEAARIHDVLAGAKADVLVYDPAYWERDPTASDAEADDERPPRPATARPDLTAARREAMRSRLAKSPASKEALGEQFGVSDRTVDADLDALGATVAGKDGRKQLWGLPDAKSEVSSQ